MLLCVIRKLLLTTTTCIIYNTRGTFTCTHIGRYWCTYVCTHVDFYVRYYISRCILFYDRFSTGYLNIENANKFSCREYDRKRCQTFRRARTFCIVKSFSSEISEFGRLTRARCEKVPIMVKGETDVCLSRGAIIPIRFIGRY